MKKKLLSVLICMTMSVGMLPTMAYAAEEGTEFEEQQVTIPEKPAATQIPESYMVSCGEHGTEMVNLIGDTFAIGDVTEEGGSYVCPVTIATAAYAEAYSAKEGKHTAVAESISFNMTWNGSGWEAPAMTQLPVIEVVCEKEVVPAAPAATQIPESYMVSCGEHGSAQMDLIWDTFTIGDVTENGDSYVCPVTIATAAYAEAYSVKNGKHTAAEESISFNMTWTGSEWKAPEMTELPVINVVCEKEVAPEAPAATSIPTSYIVSCGEHGSAQMDLIWDTFTIGDVTENGDSYVCPVTIATAAYAEAYSVKNGKHTAAEESISFNMTWTGSEWKAPEMTELPVINVVCEKEVAPEAPAATSIPTSYIVSCGEHGSAQMDLIWDTFTIGDVTENGDSYVCPVTIATAAYAEAYSVKNGKHTAAEESISFNMTWTGSEWKAPEMTELPVINVVCEKEVAPEAPAATSIPTSYIVSCGEHGSAQMDLIWDTFTIGEVTKDGDSYVCPITIATVAYAEAYSAENGKHTAVAETITYNMTWTGSEWKAPEMTELPVINVVCEKEVAPEAPAATSIPTSYIVACEDHAAAQMNLLPDTFTIGEVTKDGDSYVCPITIATVAYAEAYSAENGKHTAVAETITYNMTWTGSEWKAPEMTELPVINVVCEKEVAPEAPAATSIPTSYIVACEDHAAAQMNLLPDTFTIGEVTKDGDSYVCPITIATVAYAEAYSAENGKHTAVAETITYNMTWTGSEWKAPEMTELPVINVVCEKEVAPEAPAATSIPTSYIVACEDHAAAQMNLLPDTFTIGEVTKDGDSYVCPITIATVAYAEAYSAENGKHTAVAETITYNMTWTGSEWKAPEMTELPVINVVCEKEVAPEAPAATSIPTSYIVACEDHAAAQMNLLPDTFTIGEVTKDGDSYVCPITISTAAYAEKYSADHGKHTAAEESISFNMTWTGSEWKAPEMTELPVINVACEKEVVPAAPVESELAMGYMVKCKKGSFFHGGRFVYQLPETISIGEVEKKGDNYVCEISVSTKAYADAYSKEFRRQHTAFKSNITYNMTWDGEQWKAPAYSNLPTIEVECARRFHFFPFVW